jgi:hypothetical protein
MWVLRIPGFVLEGGTEQEHWPGQWHPNRRYVTCKPDAIGFASARGFSDARLNRSLTCDCLTAVIAAIAVWLSAGTAVGQDPAPVRFARDIEPILRAHCYECHDGAKKTADLRLDIRANAMRGGESGDAAIVPGNSDASGLIARVTDDDTSQRMPPERPPLGQQQIDLLRRWIDQGADWPDQLAGEDIDPSQHWAFRPPQAPPLPQVHRDNWVRNEIDRFVLARLEQVGLTPAIEADRTTLIRRLYLDLIGLPPTVEEVDAFLLDNRPDAYQQLVESLLRSPHYGERWGRVWLDAARYADSDGYEKDKLRQVWFYRDWVIQALNDDMPYDEFIIEQLAGDMLPGATQSQRVATGFLRNSMINEEGGIHPEQFRMLAMFDRMEAIGKSILGLTIQCGQCHNHKYDPLTQQEYYQLFAFINNDHEANVAVYTAQEQKQQSTIRKQIAQIERQLQDHHPDWESRMSAWEDLVRGDQPTWQVIQPDVDSDSTGGQKYLPQEDGSFLALGYAPTKHTVKMTITSRMQGITGFRLELLTDPNLPCGGPGRAVYGTAALTEFSVEAGPGDGSSPPREIKWADATADINPPESPLEPMFDDRSGDRRVTGPVQFAIDGNRLTAWGIDAGPGRRNQARKAVFRAAEPISSPAGETKLIIHLKQDHGGWNSDDNQNNNLGRMRLSITTADHPQADRLPAEVRQILGVPREQRTADQQQKLFGYWRTTVPEWREANERIEVLWREYPVGSTQLVLQSRDQPRATHVLMRGDFLQPAEQVQPGVPAFLHQLPDEAPPTRLTLARWLVDRRSPTVARAFVNRIWQTYFGLGLVETSEDLGTRGAAPTHPELLDWLSVEFMDRGWSIKDLHRMIVVSATYRQSSLLSEQLLRQDPFNHLLARGARFRVDAEVVRDIALSVSGLLSPEIGGPSVHPPLPEFMVNPPVSYGPKPWPEAEGTARYRRAVYTFRFRSVPYPALEVFDSPNGDVSCVRRTRSNTPLQALTMWNEDIFVECAQGLAARLLAQQDLSDEDRARYGFRLCVSRQPSSAELSELVDLLQEQRAYLNSRTDNGASALELPQTSDAPRPLPDVSSVEFAAWTTVARVLLNLDETVSKE